MKKLTTWGLLSLIVMLGLSVPAEAATKAVSAYDKLVATYSKKSRFSTLQTEGSLTYNVFVYPIGKETNIKAKPDACPAQGTNLYMNQYRVAYFKKGAAKAEIIDPGSFPLTGKYSFVYTIKAKPNLLVFSTCESGPLSSYNIFTMVNGKLKKVLGLGYGISHAIRPTGVDGQFQNVEYTENTKEYAFVNYNLDKTKSRFTPVATFKLTGEKGYAAYTYWKNNPKALINESYMEQAGAAE